MRWFTARLRFAILTYQNGLERYCDSVVMLRASTRDAAFEKALELGRKRETTYRNLDEVAIRWCLASVVSLDEVQEDSLNGAEVLSLTVVPVEAGIAWHHEFHPVMSVPAETM